MFDCACGRRVRGNVLCWHTQMLPLNSIPYLKTFTLQLSVMCFSFGWLVFFFVPHWMRCERSHLPPAYLEELAFARSDRQIYHGKEGGWAEKQVEKFSVSTWECEVSHICAIFESCKKASTCFAVLEQTSPTRNNRERLIQRKCSGTPALLWFQNIIVNSKELFNQCA